jgi:hypothetical protein
MPASKRSAPALALLAAVLLSAPAVRVEAAADADQVFGRFSHLVTQVRIVNRASGSKSALGSAFFVQRDGYLITNYHVIAELVSRPDEYFAELVGADGETTPVSLLNVDVIHDLAILRAERHIEAPLKLHDGVLPKGTRLFSLGNPHDLGLAIVEGTYNGRIRHSLYEKMHFSGSINPGMSGGPTINGDGGVVGINVSTAGNALSFLVPAKFARRLLDDTLETSATGNTEALLEVTRRQLLANQESLFNDILAQPFAATELGRYSLPGELAPYFNCWGDDTRVPKEPYEHVRYQCSTDEPIFVTDNVSAGSIEFTHGLLSSKELNRFQFFALYERFFQGHRSAMEGSEEQVGTFECQTDFVGHQASTFKVVFCARAYKKLSGLYDMMLKAASLDDNHEGVYTDLKVTGISFENAKRMARQYLESIHRRR